MQRANILLSKGSMKETTTLSTKIITSFTVLVLLIIYAVGCAATPGQVEDRPDSSTDSGSLPSPSSQTLEPPLPSFTSPSVPTAEATETTTLDTPEPPAETLPETTITAVTLEPPVDTLQIELQSCLSDANNNFALQWTSLSENLRQINGVSNPIRSLEVSADGRWLVASSEVDVQNQLPILSTWMIDTMQERHLQLNANVDGNVHLTDWFSNSQLLWVTEDGNVALGNGEASENLNAPTQIVEVWYAAEGVGFAKDSDGVWWRVNIEQKEWETVSTADSEPLSGLGVIGISQDASHALLYQPEQLWHLPLGFTDEATEIPSPDLSLAGTDSGFMPAVIQLGSESNWFIGASIWYSSGDQESYPLDGFILNTAEGRLLVNSDFGIPDTYKIVGFDASPDGQWIAVSFNQSLQTTNVEPQAVYITQADSPMEGDLFQDVKIIGLGTEHAFLSDSDNKLVILELASGDAAMIAGAEFVSAANNFLVARETSTHIAIIDLTNNTVHRLNIPQNHDLQRATISPTNAVYLYLENMQSDTCPYALIEYQQ